MPVLVVARFRHTCCVVREALVVLGGVVGYEYEEEEDITSRVEILSGGENGVFADLQASSYSSIVDTVAIAVEESGSHSPAGQVLLLWGENDYGEHSSTVLLVDLASDECMP